MTMVHDVVEEIRAALRTAFPAQIFSVRAEQTGSGYAVDVRWSGGPSADDVAAIAQPLITPGLNLALRTHRYA